MKRDSVFAARTEGNFNLSPFVTDASLLAPDHTDLPSTWYEHVPFAFWIVGALKPSCLVELGTHHGLSYLSFCQSIDELGLNARAYAVDTWKGDEHAGLYDEDVFFKLSALHDSRYASFSRLVRATFDEAVDHFANGTIDLLHIDGLHTYDAVRHDFETWRPKLAPRAIVLFHDTNVRERGFGVWKLWRELAESFPHFEFLHGHGLGILGIGSDFPPAINALFAAADNEQAQIELRNLFARLGGLVSRQAHVRRTVNEILAEVAARDARIAELSAEVAARDSRIAEVSAEVAARDSRIAEVSAEAADRDARIHEMCAEVAAGDARIAEMCAEVAARDARIAEMCAEVAARDARIAEVCAEVAARDARIHEMSAEAAALAARAADANGVDAGAEVARCGSMIAELRRMVADEQAATQAALAEKADLAKRLVKMKKSLSWRATRPLRWRLPKPAKQLRKVIRSKFKRPAAPPPEAVAELRLPQVITEPAATKSRPRVLFVSGEPATPGHHYRVENIRGALAPRFYETDVMKIGDLADNLHRLAGADILWIWRVVWDDVVCQAVTAARTDGVRIVFDVDDLMFLPELAKVKTIDGIRTQGLTEQQVAEGYSLVKQTLLHADHCTAPTSTLAQQMRWLFKPASVIPNGFDRHTLAVARKTRMVRNDGSDDGWLRIGYASGSRTHQRDFAVASRALAEVLAAHPRVRLVLFEHTIDMAEFPELSPFADRTEWRSLVPIADLPNEYARFDINIAPLEIDNPFCEAKSELKFFEPALVGVATVASPTRPFQEAITHGETGFLAGDQAEWRRCLEMLIGDPALRRRIADKAFADVIWRYGPERRIVLVNSLVGQLLAPPNLAAHVTRSLLIDPWPAKAAVDVPEADVILKSELGAASRVTIVIPLHNYAHYVVEALESVKNQTIEDLDLIVVDDQSTDESLVVAKKWIAENGARFNRAVLLQNRQNLKLAKTRNVGIFHADTEFVMPLDADNQLLPMCVERCMKLLDETNAAMVYPTIEMFGDRTGVMTTDDWDPARLQFANYIDAMAMFRKACWQAVGGYSAIDLGWEDWELWCKFIEAGFWGARVPEVSARYRVHGASMLRAITHIPHHRQQVVDELTRRHPWLDIVPQPAEEYEAPPETETLERKRSMGLERQGAASLLFILQCPETGEPLERHGDELRAVSSDCRWPIVDGRPVFTEEGRNVHHQSPEHVSNPLPKRALDLIQSAEGMVLNMSGGAASCSFDHVIEAEYSLFRTTDVAADAHRLPFKDNSFAAVVCLNAFEHYRNPTAVADEIRRVLRPGGRLLIHTAFMQPLHEAPHHYFNCTRYGLEEWLKQFDIEQIHVSSNLNPAYAFSWLASDLEAAFAASVSEKAAADFLSAPVGSFVSLWRDEALRQSPLWQAFFQLPQELQERCAAGWEVLAHRPSEGPSVN